MTFFLRFFNCKDYYIINSFSAFYNLYHWGELLVSLPPPCYLATHITVSECLDHVSNF